ncbi:hypothetical protein HJFPF1_09566 [Paramyrothecium foliicola]|nr:hypothetical protein HJFPF1_09566 [Paramyrothecium foliicola]
MKALFAQHKLRLEKRNSSQAGGLPLNIDFQRAFTMPNRFARFVKLAALVVVFFVVYLILKQPPPPPKRIYVTDLVLKTPDLRDAGDISPKPHSDHGVNDTGHGAQPGSKHVMNCDIDTSRVRDAQEKYDLGEQIEYLKRYVRFTRKPVERPSYTTLEQTFLPDGEDSFRTLDFSKSYQHEEDCRDPLEVTVSESNFPADVDLSEFMFAISTNYERLSNITTIKEWAYWLTNSNGRSNGGKLLLRLLDATEQELSEIAQRLADVGIDAEVSALDSWVEKEMAVNYLNLVPMLYTHEDSASKKWLVLCDDDTFFTAIGSVVARFKQFDPSQPLYVGTLSEDIFAVQTHGSQAFGGAGVFLSRPLAKIINSVHETCKTKQKINEANSGWGAQGDILLRKCIYENTDVRLFQLQDLWQLDISGDASGFYEGGFKPFSVHHFKSEELWHTAYPFETTKIAHTCGEDCPYQRFVTKDNFIISNGYSVAQYNDGIDFELGQVERTFHPLLQDKVWNFDYTYGPQRPTLSKTGKKLAWELRESQITDDGAVSQLYIRKKDDERWFDIDEAPMKALDGIIELVWIQA